MTKKEIEAYLIAGRILGVPIVNQTGVKVDISFLASRTAAKVTKAEKHLHRNVAEGTDKFSWMSNRKVDKLEKKTIEKGIIPDDERRHFKPRNGS